MSRKTRPKREPAPVAAAAMRNPAATSGEIEGYGGGHIQSRHGTINRWLLLVYAILFIWSLYYGFTYWGGLGPGLDY